MLDTKYDFKKVEENKNNNKGVTRKKIETSRKNGSNRKYLS